MGVMQRDLFWPAPIIRDRRQFDFDGETVKNGIDDFDVLEDFAADFGYVTVFQVDDKFYDDQGGKVKAVEVDDPNPKITASENEIFARIGYKTMNFGAKERDAFVLNKACFKKAKMHPVFVLKITNPYSKIDPEPLVPGLQRSDSTHTYRSFEKYTSERMDKETDISEKIIEDEVNAGARPEFLRKISTKRLSKGFTKKLTERLCKNKPVWMESVLHSVANGNALWDKVGSLIRNDTRLKRRKRAGELWDELVPLVQLHLLTRTPELDNKSLHDSGETPAVQSRNVNPRLTERLCSLEDKLEFEEKMNEGKPKIDEKTDSGETKTATKIGQKFAAPSADKTDSASERSTIYYAAPIQQLWHEAHEKVLPSDI